MSERLTTEHLRIEYRDDPDLLALMDEYEVLRARVAKLEALLHDVLPYISSIELKSRLKEYSRTRPQ